MKTNSLLKSASLIMLCTSILLSCSTIDSPDENNNNNTGGYNPTATNDLKDGEIVLKTYGKASYYEKIKIGIITKNVTVNWGDGTVEEITPNGYICFSHVYDNNNYQTITLNTKGLQHIDGAGGKYTAAYEFMLGNCPDLESLTCDVKNNFSIKRADKLAYIDIGAGSNITELDFSHLPSLKVIQISSEEAGLQKFNISGLKNLIYINAFDLSEAAENELYDNLPENKNGNHQIASVITISVDYSYTFDSEYTSYTIYSNWGHPSDRNRVIAESKG